MRKILAVAIVAVLMAACGDDTEPGADGGADASLVEYSEENCETLFEVSTQTDDPACCYSGGYMPGCGDGLPGTNVVALDSDGTIGCIDAMVVPEEFTQCAFFECEIFVDDVSECE